MCDEWKIVQRLKRQVQNGSSANNVINIAEEPFVLIRQNYIFHT